MWSNSDINFRIRPGMETLPLHMLRTSSEMRREIKAARPLDKSCPIRQQNNYLYLVAAQSFCTNFLVDKLYLVTIHTWPSTRAPNFVAIIDLKGFIEKVKSCIIIHNKATQQDFKWFFSFNWGTKSENSHNFSPWA